MPLVRGAQSRMQALRRMPPCDGSHGAHTVMSAVKPADINASTWILLLVSIAMFGQDGPADVSPLKPTRRVSNNYIPSRGRRIIARRRNAQIPKPTSASAMNW